ncbi:mechanosensitive ion channel family protein [Oceanicella sp. SM1341]|uniref:mechanosensitive ion channel family protein n=1 Tax=Oceanicella sp. SM1341 TaxID=1548889 RepID=UPI000E52BCC5|nr:mechanosensitive ion channel family protein [Oceanicella sp. SM1341]
MTPARPVPALSCFLLLLLAGWLALFAPPALAQHLPGPPPPQQQAPDAVPEQDLTGIVEAAQKAGLEILVLRPATGAAAGGPVPPAEEAEAEVDGLIRRLTLGAEAMKADLAATPGWLDTTLYHPAPPLTPFWLGRATLLTVFSLGLGGLAGWAAGRRLRRSLLPPPPAPGALLGTRLRFLLGRSVVALLVMAVILLVSTLVALVLGTRDSGFRGVFLSTLEVAITGGLVMIAFRAILAPWRPDSRVLPFEDAEAKRIHLLMRLTVWSALFFSGVAALVRRMQGPDGFADLLLDLSTLIVAAGLIRAVYLARPLFVRLAEADLRPVRFWHRHWHVLFTTYLVFTVVVTLLARLLDLDIEGLVAAPILAVLIGLVVKGLGLIAIESFYLDRPARSAAGAEPGPPVTHPWRGWALSSLNHVALAAAAVWLVSRWDIGLLTPDGRVHAVWVILLMALVGSIGWEAIRTAFDRRLAEEEGTAPGAEGEGDGESEMGTGKSRLATLLPLFRNAVLIAILVLVSMVMLSSLGVDVAPLFAGAGLIGFAVGFGAQALVRDVFSGVFFLIDDAFRVGEYIETGSAKGTVERISIRSMQLRHQNGPLHTVPFGEITQLTNYSRDWVIMKLPIAARYGTDPEKVRKIVKKLGLALLEDPELGPKFIEPLKSQGVLEISDTGLVFRVKFKTRPGEQFVLRKTVFHRISEAFAKEGIEFAGREVRVRVLDEDDRTVPPDDPRAQQAVAAAAGEIATEAAQGEQKP